MLIKFVYIYISIHLLFNSKYIKIFFLYNIKLTKLLRKLIINKKIKIYSIY